MIPVVVVERTEERRYAAVVAVIATSSGTVTMNRNADIQLSGIKMGVLLRLLKPFFLVLDDVFYF